MLLCCVEIYIKINTYWLVIKFIPRYPELFPFFLFLILNDCLSASLGIFQRPGFSSLLCSHWLHISSWTRLSSKSDRGMSDSKSNPNLFTGSGWRKQTKADEKGNLSRRPPWWSRKPWHADKSWFVCVFFSEACIMALTLSLLIVTISGKPMCRVIYHISSLAAVLKMSPCKCQPAVLLDRTVNSPCACTQFQHSTQDETKSLTGLIIFISCSWDGSILYLLWIAWSYKRKAAHGRLQLFHNDQWLTAAIWSVPHLLWIRCAETTF